MFVYWSPEPPAAHHKRAGDTCKIWDRVSHPVERAEINIAPHYSTIKVSNLTNQCQHNAYFCRSYKLLHNLMYSFQPIQFTTDFCLCASLTLLSFRERWLWLDVRYIVLKFAMSYPLFTQRCVSCAYYDYIICFACRHSNVRLFSPSVRAWSIIHSFYL